MMMFKSILVSLLVAFTVGSQASINPIDDTLFFVVGEGYFRVEQGDSQDAVENALDQVKTYCQKEAVQITEWKHTSERVRGSRLVFKTTASAVFQCL